MIYVVGAKSFNFILNRDSSRGFWFCYFILVSGFGCGDVILVNCVF